MTFEIHQLEGVDPIGRMFSRDLTIDLNEEGYQGTFRYEGIWIQSDRYPDVEQVCWDIARKLQRKSFAQIRTRLNFREERYYAERQPWVNYDASSSST